MAELAASVLTIAQVACVLFERTQKALEYIEEVRSISDPICDLLAKVRALQRLTKTVASTYAQAEPNVSSESKSLRQIRKELKACQERLDRLKLLAFELASLRSTTMRERFTIKRRMDRVERDTKTLDQGIQHNINMLHFGLACLNVELNATRRASDTIAVPQAITVPRQISDSSEEFISPLSHTYTNLSSATTVFGRDPDLQLRIFSTSLSLSPEPSVFSTSSQGPLRTNVRNDSVTSATELAPLTAKNEWKDFDFQIIKCGGTKERIQEILQRHPDGIALAKSTDTYQRTWLHAAAQRGNVELVRVLIDDYRADINAQDSKPHSVLDLAVMNRRGSVVALLLDRGVDEDAISPSIKDKFKEMKRAIAHEEKAVAERMRSRSRSEQSGVTK
jgi:hypothetical protein